MARPPSDGDGLPSFLFPSLLGTGWTAGFVATLGFTPCIWVGTGGGIFCPFPPILLDVPTLAGFFLGWSLPSLGFTLVPGSLEPSRYLLPSWLTGLAVVCL